jgi:hypothetical protein
MRKAARKCGFEFARMLGSVDRHGFPMVQVAQARDEVFHASRLDPGHRWARWAAASMRRSAHRPPAILPSSGGSLANDIFAELLALPTIWVPHSYRGCSQHVPNEHLPLAIAREGLALMAGLARSVCRRRTAPDTENCDLTLCLMHHKQNAPHANAAAQRTA